MKANEATGTDLPRIKELEDLNFVVGKDLLYQQTYLLSPEQQKEFGVSKIIPDIVLCNWKGNPIAVIENKAIHEQKAFEKLRLIYAKVLKVRFLYACSAERILFFDTEWDSNETFARVSSFMTAKEMESKIYQSSERKKSKPVSIDLSIAGGFDRNIGKTRYFQTECIETLLTKFKAGKRKMLVQMATGLGKTRMIVAFCKVLLESTLAQKILFVVDRRLLAEQAQNSGFSLISTDYHSSRLTTYNFENIRQNPIHIVVIDSLEEVFAKIPSHFYDLIIVDECHRSLSFNRSIILDHFVCPRIGLTATPKISIANTSVAESENNENGETHTSNGNEYEKSVADTYTLFGCASGIADYTFGMERGISEGFLAPYKVVEVITDLVQQAKEEGILFRTVIDPEQNMLIDLGQDQILSIEKFNKKFISIEHCLRVAEELRNKTALYEKILVFGASQAHCYELQKAFNQVFPKITHTESRYAATIISNNGDDVNRSLKEWFVKVTEPPYIAISVDIMSTGVDIPCLRHLAFVALTQSSGKYNQMIGRGTRIDKDSGKFSFTVFDFIGLCETMKDAGKGSPIPNEGTQGSEKIPATTEEKQPKHNFDYALLDNPDPENLIQRIKWHNDQISFIENTPIEVVFEMLKKAIETVENPKIIALFEKLKAENYKPNETDENFLLQWLADPDLFLTETDLAKIAGFPITGTQLIFHILGGKTQEDIIKEKMQSNYETYLQVSQHLNDAQIQQLNKIKGLFVANYDDFRITWKELLQNPLYQQILLSDTEMNSIFENNWQQVFQELKKVMELKSRK